MTTRDSNRKFQPGPGWLLFFGMIAVLVFNRNSRDVVKAMMEQVKVQTHRMGTEYDGLKSTLKKKREEAGKTTVD
ncbi:hypothetical protein [Prosthecobacter vanneervenii]|uniref:Uncharacterized protein n=1 Tax=Prosthecobacter vanneervenii TaxID=48466 RepID=A0A7W7YGB4_9BACT|nr:hypothetical protein [Prosthecobacter vanneervenii]MBB5035325.1 hypothetical protein [Prosthecobacter vanneervenii]